METYILRAVSRDGEVGFYCGRAGSAWVSDRHEAFEYQSRERANKVATNFNRMEPVHGYWFLVVAA